MIPLLLIVSLVLQQSPAAPRPAGPVPSPATLAADTGALHHTNGRPAPYAEVLRLTGPTPRIDGDLSDPAWALARPITEFTQSAPHDGQPATERTDVRIAYDDRAIYVAARLYDSRPDLIAVRLGRRDADVPADEFGVDFDSYHDHRTSFGFGVNAAGERQDLVRTDDQSSGDPSWDPIWDAAVRRDSLGWTVEMRIPLSQLRFPRGAAQVWGVHLRRWIHRKAESASFGWAAQTDNGFASYFGHLHGFRDLSQPRRLEVLPYVTAREERLDPGGPGNPFNDGSRQRAGAGLDLSCGLGSDLTLNAAINPDFGQVEADPAIVNLTAFESYFEERRPFFVEGAGIFRFAQAGMFRVGGVSHVYSRRIGREPQGSAQPRGGFADTPTSSTILGAAKLSGRVLGGWALGAMEAVTAREFSTVDSAGVRFRDEVEPLTSYAVVRGRREFRSGASTVGFVATAVNRDIRSEGLRFLRSAAYSGGADLAHRFGGNRYTAWASVGYSYVRGDSLAIRRTQESSVRYFQRPDARYLHFSSSRTSLTGWTAIVGLSKDAGNWQYGVTGQAVSPGFEVNDAGFQVLADNATVAFFAQRRWTRPGRTFRSGALQTLAVGGWNFGGDRTDTQLHLNGALQLLNYWQLNASVMVSPRTANDDLTRGGPLAMDPSQWVAGASVSTDFRKSVVAGLSSTYARDGLDGWLVSFAVQAEVRPSSRLSLTFGPTFSARRSPQQFVTAQPDPAATATFGGEYVFAEVLQRTLDLTTRVDLALTPNLSLQLYVQPFIGTADYTRFKQLRAPRTTDYIIFNETSGSTLRAVADPDGGIAGYVADADGAAGPMQPVAFANPDFSFRSLRGNAVLRWEYRPGSTLYVVWTASCSNYLANPGFSVGRDLARLCPGRSDHVVAVKLNYWMSP